MEVKDIIRNRRLELDLTLEQIAQRVGVSKPTVMRWENGDIENMRADKIAPEKMRAFKNLRQAHIFEIYAVVSFPRSHTLL